MRCPYCQHHDSKVLDTSHDSHGGIRRRRECFNCGQRFSTYERPILATPLIVKQDGTREEFDREKMARGIRISQPNRAEGLHKVLYQCPSCNAEHKMDSKGAEIFCTSCGKHWEMDELGSLHVTTRGSGRPNS